MPERSVVCRGFGPGARVPYVATRGFWPGLLEVFVVTRGFWPEASVAWAVRRGFGQRLVELGEFFTFHRRRRRS